MNHLANTRIIFRQLYKMNYLSTVLTPVTHNIPMLMKQYNLSTMTGAQFKSIFKNYNPCKVIRPNEKIVYKEGLVSGDEQFKQYVYHEEGGLYFTTISIVGKYICSDNDKIAILNILDHETIHIGDIGCETNSFIVEKILDVGDFVRLLQETNYDDFIELMKDKPRLLKYVNVDEQTREMCMNAVPNDVRSRNELNMRFFTGGDSDI